LRRNVEVFGIWPQLRSSETGATAEKVGYLQVRGSGELLLQEQIRIQLQGMLFFSDANFAKIFTLDVDISGISMQAVLVDLPIKTCLVGS
jgi:hypothetical protein